MFEAWRIDIPPSAATCDENGINDVSILVKIVGFFLYNVKVSTKQ